MLSKKTAVTEKPISALTLAEIQNELSDIPRRMELLKAERDKWASSPLSREELRQKVNSWFSNVAAQGADDLLSRLKTSGFMRKVDSNPDVGILTNGSSQVWKSNSVDAVGLCVIFSPIVADFLNSWVSSLPESEVGGTTAAERDSQLERIELERQSLIARRNALRQILNDTAASADAVVDVYEITKGGRPGGLDLERLEQKAFES